MHRARTAMVLTARVVMLFSEHNTPVSNTPGLRFPVMEFKWNINNRPDRKRKDKDRYESRRKWQTNWGKKEWEENIVVHIPVAFLREGKCILASTQSFDVHTLCKHFFLRDGHIVKLRNTFKLLFHKACNPSFLLPASFLLSLAPSNYIILK